jgi:hypothetical protein
MIPSIQRLLLLVLAAVVPVGAYVASRADVVAAVAAVNVVLIWASLRIATGGSRWGGDGAANAGGR